MVSMLRQRIRCAAVQGLQTRWASSSQRGGGRRRPYDGPSYRARERTTPTTTTRDGASVPQPRGELLYGIHSVLQALSSGCRRAHTLYVRDGDSSTAKSDAASVLKIQSIANDHGIDIQPISKWMLNHITDDKPHQGVVLDVDPLKLPDFSHGSLTAMRESTTRPIILAMDEIHDTQNLGAILRSAHFLGCSAVLLSERNSAPVSPAVSRASAGALEVLVANNKLLRVKNLHQALALSKEQGWRVVGACSGPNSITSTQLASDQPTILVMGNEHKGLRKGIRQCCDEIVTIPGQITEDDSRVDSLNVSVASAILLYELLHH